MIPTSGLLNFLTNLAEVIEQISFEKQLPHVIDFSLCLNMSRMLIAEKDLADSFWRGERLWAFTVPYKIQDIERKGEWKNTKIFGTVSGLTRSDSNTHVYFLV